MAMKKVKQRRARQAALEKGKENKRIEAEAARKSEEAFYNDLMSNTTFENMKYDYVQNHNEIMNNLNYNTNTSVKSAMEEARINAPNKPVVTAEDFGVVENFIYSGDDLIDNAFNGDIAAGRSYDEIRSGINKARRQGVINEDQYNLAKRTLEQNESFINNLGKSADNVATKQVVREVSEEVAEGAVDVGNPYLKQVFSGRNLGAVLNLGFAISDYNQARNAGDGVIKAGAKAGAQFVAGEMLGGWMMPVMLAKQVPTMAISAIEGTQKITRQMNSTGRIQTFGEAEFRDTQQLATMRQAGMELAKMSQYNLQQSIMGNEAQYMHKL